MIDLEFAVAGARVEPHSAQPRLVVTLALRERHLEAVEGVALQCQLRIEPRSRRYAPDEERCLVDLFGVVSRWTATATPLAWLDTALLVPAFSGHTEVELPLPLSYDLEVSAGRYFQGLDSGEVPVRLLFRGSVFVRSDRGLQMTPLPWDREATWRLPVALWRQAMDSHFPDAGWLRLRRPTLDALLAYKGRHALASWDGVMETLLAEDGR